MQGVSEFAENSVHEYEVINKLRLSAIDRIIHVVPCSPEGTAHSHSTEKINVLNAALLGIS